MVHKRSHGWRLTDLEALGADEVALPLIAVDGVLLHQLADVLHVGEDVAVAQAALQLLCRQEAVAVDVQLRCTATTKV